MTVPGNPLDSRSAFWNMNIVFNYVYFYDYILMFKCYQANTALNCSTTLVHRGSMAGFCQIYIFFQDQSRVLSAASQQGRDAGISRTSSAEEFSPPYHYQINLGLTFQYEINFFGNRQLPTGNITGYKRQQKYKVSW